MTKSEKKKLLFEKIYNRYVKLMFKIAKSFFCTEEEQEDAVSEALVKIAANIHKLSMDTPEQDIKTRSYVAVIVNSVCMDMLRKKKRLNREISLGEAELEKLGQSYEFEEIVETEDTDILDKIEEEQLYRLFSILSREERNLLSMYIVQEMKTGEIARMLNINRETVKKRIQRIMSKLRKVAKENEERQIF